MEIIGHRGAKNLVCENTLESIKEAMKHGLKAVEVDLKITKDKQIVLFHDEDLSRFKGSGKNIHKMTLTELQKIKLKNKHRIPSLREAFQKFGSQLTWILDIKDSKAIPLLGELKLPRKVIISSFRTKDLELIKKHLPSRQAALLTYRFSKNIIRQAKKLKSKTLHLKITKANAKNLELCKKEKIKVRAWTVNNLRRAKFYKKHGVAGIFTDRPDIINHKKLNEK